MKEDSKTHYEILGVPSSAPFPEIKAAFLLLAKKHHPDKRPAGAPDEKFSCITEAYRVLSDSVLRYVYDMELGIQPEADVIPVSGRLEEPTVTGNAAADYVETLAGGIKFPVLTEIAENVFEFSGMEDVLVKKAYSAGLYSFGGLSKLSVREYYERGMKAVRDKKYRAAELFLAESVRMSPRNLQYRFALGAVYLAAGAKEKAVFEFREVIRLGGLKGYFCLPVRESLVKACLELGDYSGVKAEAREILRRGVKSIPAENALRLARVFERKNSSGGGANESC